LPPPEGVGEEEGEEVAMEEEAKERFIGRPGTPTSMPRWAANI